MEQISAIKHTLDRLLPRSQALQAKNFSLKPELMNMCHKRNCQKRLGTNIHGKFSKIFRGASPFQGFSGDFSGASSNPGFFQGFRGFQGSLATLLGDLESFGVTSLTPIATIAVLENSICASHQLSDCLSAF